MSKEVTFFRSWTEPGKGKHHVAIECDEPMPAFLNEAYRMGIVRTRPEIHTRAYADDQIIRVGFETGKLISSWEELKEYLVDPDVALRDGKVFDMGFHDEGHPVSGTACWRYALVQYRGTMFVFEWRFMGDGTTMTIKNVDY